MHLTFLKYFEPVCSGWFRARRLTDEQRSAIATYFAIYKGQENGVVKLALTQTLHPAVQRAYTLLEEAWREVCCHNMMRMLMCLCFVAQCGM